MEQLAERFYTEKHTVHSYLPLYDEIFRSGRFQRILYITVHSDQSIKLFHAYFRSAQIDHIYILSDDVTPYTLQFLNQHSSEYDLIIHDDPRLDVLKFVARNYETILSPNGMMILESIPNPLWIGDIKNSFLAKDQVQVHDRRKIKHRVDDILIGLHLPSRVGTNLNRLKSKSRHSPFLATGSNVLPRNKTRITTLHQPRPSSFMQTYPTLFHKYIHRLSQPGHPAYTIIHQVEFQSDRPYVCHFHIYDVDQMNEFQPDLDRIFRSMNIVLTYSIGTLPSMTEQYTVLQVKNQGYDIGGKICAIDYMYRHQILPEYVLFLHSKSDLLKRRQYFDPLIKSDQRLDLICTLMEMKQTNVLGIFPNILWYDHQGHKNYDQYDVYAYDEPYWKEILDYLKCTNRDRVFAEGNCMVLHNSVINFVFEYKTELWYHLLNHNNSIDWNWFRIYYPEYAISSFEHCYQEYTQKKLFGNNTPLKQTELSIPDGMFEHVFERMWINVINHLNGQYLILDSQNTIDRYNIKINGIYFPQFHTIPENDEFWGEGFTEWTLLQPYESAKFSLMKPHPDIGYYDLSDESVLQSQIDMATTYGIHGFIIYHYWFKDNHKILYKPLEKFLSPDYTFPFAISWANETWTRRWDGSDQEVLLSQEYGSEDDYRAHIRYLIPFFQRPNYIRSATGECLFYIYNFYDAKESYDVMMDVWNQELCQHDLSIKIIITENSFDRNHNLCIPKTSGFIFEPMYSTCFLTPATPDVSDLITSRKVTIDNFDFEYYLDQSPDLKPVYQDKSIEQVYDHFLNFGSRENRPFKYGHTIHQIGYIYDYDQIITQYQSGEYDTQNKHLGLPLYWNNIVRRKNLPYVEIQNFDLDRLRRMLNVLLGTILLRHTGGLGEVVPMDNIINVNAWNEWNEQATLEPNDTLGYSILETMADVIRHA